MTDHIDDLIGKARRNARRELARELLAKRWEENPHTQITAEDILRWRREDLREIAEEGE